MGKQLYPHQQRAVDRLANGKILYGDMGVGKTLTALAYFWQKVIEGDDVSGRPKKPMPLYVITTAKKRDDLDWEKDAATFGISRDPDSSIPGVHITVDSWNNIKKYENVLGAMFIFDEQRLVGAGAWVKAFLRIAKHNQWILLTATPGDTWLDYIPVFVANGFYKNRTEFKREHVIYTQYGKFPKVDRYIGVGKMVRYRNQLLVDMPFVRHTTREIIEIPVEHDRDLFKKVVKERWNVFENRPIKDVAELFIVMRKVANSHPSRLEQVRKLMEKHPRLVVFYNFDYELEALRTLSNFEMSTGTETQS